MLTRSHDPFSSHAPASPPSMWPMATGPGTSPVELTVIERPSPAEATATLSTVTGNGQASWESPPVVPQGTPAARPGRKTRTKATGSSDDRLAAAIRALDAKQGKL